MHGWLKALEIVRLQKGESKNKLETSDVMPRSQYNRMLRSKRSPRLDVFERALHGMGATWQEWAAVYEARTFAHDGDALLARLMEQESVKRGSINPYAQKPRKTA